MKTTPESVRILLEQGKSVKHTALALGICTQRVYQIIRKHGFSVVKKEKPVKVRRQRISPQAKKFGVKRNMMKYLGEEWTLEFEDVVWPKFCPVLGLELNYAAGGRQENSPSIDRVDSNRGYVADNVCVISWRANRIKNNGTAEEHRLIADYIDSKLK